MANITVKPEVLQWAVRYSDLSEDVIYGRFPWVCETPAQTTFRKLEDFAKVLRVPFSSLLLGEIPQEEPLPIPDFRTAANQNISKPSLNLRAILHIMALRQEWMRDYLISEGADTLPFVGSLMNAENPIAAAKKIREDLGLSVGWQNKFSNWESANTFVKLLKMSAFCFFRNADWMQRIGSDFVRKSFAGSLWRTTTLP